MSKTIGLMTVWGAGPFVEPALKQGLKNCDDLMVLVAPHHHAMDAFEDETYEICKKYTADGVKLIHTSSQQLALEVKGNPFHRDFIEANKPYTFWRTHVLNHMLIHAKPNKGDWIYLVDVDEFFFKKDFLDLKHKIEKYDSVRFEEKYFIVDMKHYVTKTSSPRLWRYDSGRFKPTDKWTNPFKNTLIVPNMFHYSLLMNPHAKRAFWATERQKPQPHKSNWIDDTYLKYDIKNEKKWLAGTYGASFGSDNGNLFVYDGKHPEHIEEAGLTKIKDFREIWK